MRRIMFFTTLALASFSVFAASWQPAVGPLMTRWAKDVSPANARPEYPRPQLVRDAWLNLNGLWDYAIADKDASQPAQWDGQRRARQRNSGPTSTNRSRSFPANIV